jgi:hypothetical protein
MGKIKEYKGVWKIKIVDSFFGAVRLGNFFKVKLVNFSKIIKKRRTSNDE